MKYLLLILIIGLSSRPLRADTNSAPEKFSDFVERLWLKGEKRKVLKIAELRLRKDENDLASLLVCFDFAASYMEVDRISMLIPRIRSHESKIFTKHFSELKPLLEAGLDSTEKILPKMTKDVIEAEAYKGDIPNKPLDSLILIMALEDDGLVPPVSIEESRIAEDVKGSQSDKEKPKANMGVDLSIPTPIP